MRVKFGKKPAETIADIMAPILSITEKLKAFKAQAEIDAKAKDQEAKDAEAAAFELREQAAEADRFIEKYS